MQLISEEQTRKLVELFRTAWAALRRHHLRKTNKYLRRLRDAKCAADSAGIMAELLAEASVSYQADIPAHLTTGAAISEFYHLCRDEETWRQTRSLCLFASACGEPQTPFLSD